MQIYALDQNNQVVSCFQAKKQISYYCIECQEEVRLRSGFELRSHFYHVRERKKCSLSRKSLAHIETQKAIQARVPDSRLEVPFPEIKRIADVFWEREKVVFEVQVSFISKEEVEKRTADYASIGIQVVWILHEKRFNQIYLTECERALLTSPHYFAAPTHEIYDQFSFIHEGKRVKRLSKYPVELNGIVRSPSSPLLVKWRHSWELGFKGDLFDRIRDEDVQTLLNWKPARKWPFLIKFKNYFALLYQYVLLKSSKY